jgi:hypothetical protein
MVWYGMVWYDGGWMPECMPFHNCRRVMHIDPTALPFVLLMGLYIHRRYRSYVSFSVCLA